MKYLWLNMKKFIWKEPMIFFLTVLCIVSSATVILFAFGLYHHTKQIALDEQYGYKFMNLEFNDDTRKVVNVDLVMEYCKSLSEDIQDSCYYYVEGQFPGDQSDIAPIDNSLSVVCMDFELEGDKVTIAEEAANAYVNNGALVEGSYFTKEQIENGELVCIASKWGVENYGDPEEQAFAAKYMPNAEGKYILNGKEYTCIGKIDSFSAVPLIPITTIDGDCAVIRMGFMFSKTITRKQYTEIVENAIMYFGDYVSYPPLEMPDLDTTKFYNTVLIECMLMMIMAGVILATLYEYIVLQRKKQLGIYRLCGMTLGKARRLYFTECFLMSLVLYIVSVCFYHSVLLPYLSKYFEYIEMSYTLKTYGIMGMLYVAVIAFIQYTMILKTMDKSVVNTMKGV